MIQIILLVSGALLGAYACRLDSLTWRAEPRQMVGHVLGGVAAAWPFTHALSGQVSAGMAVAVLLSSAWLVGSSGHASVAQQQDGRP